MIPTQITVSHILSAIEHVRRNGVPKNRASRDFDLLHEGERFPPKYLVALASEHGIGRKLDSEEFGGGLETNGFLQNLGFIIVKKDSGTPLKKAPPTSSTTRPAVHRAAPDPAPMPDPERVRAPRPTSPPRIKAPVSDRVVAPPLVGKVRVARVLMNMDAIPREIKELGNGWAFLHDRVVGGTAASPSPMADVSPG